MTVAGNVAITGDATIGGTLTYANISFLTTSNLVLGLGNNQTGVLVTGGGIVVGNTNEASWLYDQPIQSWVSNIGISAVGNITGDYFVGNGALLTGLYANANAVAYLASNAAVPITTQGNVTAPYFIGDGASLTNTYPIERLNWNTWVNGSNTAVTMYDGVSVTSTGLTGVTAAAANNYGYQLTDGNTGSVGSMYWQLPAGGWDGARPIAVKGSFAATGPATGAGAGDGPFIQFGGSTYSIGPAAPNAGISVWVCWYTGTPKIDVHNGSTQILSVPLNNPSFNINSTTVYQNGLLGVGNTNTNWYDLEVIVKPYGVKKYLEVRINGSMALQADVSTWIPTGTYVTVGARSGLATSYQYCRAVAVTW
jgi:hypothetical protein